MNSSFQMNFLMSGSRFAIALILSCVLHGGLIVAGVFQSRLGYLGERSEDIYQVSDVVENLSGVDGEKLENQLKQKTGRYVNRMDFILLDKNTIDLAYHNTEIIASQIREDAKRQEQRTVPVSKNPALKPKLIFYDPVPYPTEAAGAVGTVIVCILVGYNGRPEYTSLAESSGNRFLDAAAVEHCIGWRFIPARDSQGRIVRCLLYVPVKVKP